MPATPDKQETVVGRPFICTLIKNKFHSYAGRACTMIGPRAPCVSVPYPANHSACNLCTFFPIFIIPSSGCPFRGEREKSDREIYIICLYLYFMNCVYTLLENILGLIKLISMTCIYIYMYYFYKEWFFNDSWNLEIGMTKWKLL